MTIYILAGVYVLVLLALGLLKVMGKPTPPLKGER